MTERSISAVSEKGRSQWQRLAQLVAKDLSEADLSQLSWGTLKSVAVHSGITHPLDLAHLEVAWRTQQAAAKPSVTTPTLVASHAQTDDATAPASGRVEMTGQQNRLKAGRRPISAPQRTSTTVAAKRPAKLPTAEPAAVPQRAKPSNITVAAKVQRSVTQPVSYAVTGENASSGNAAAPCQEPPSPAAVPPSPVAVPPSPSPQKRSANGASPKKSASPPRSLSPTAAVDDLRDVFERFSGADGMTVANFLAFMRFEQFLSKSVLPRDAELLFDRSKATSSDVAVTYPQFRMRLVPDMASKLRVSIAEVVKHCRHRGLPSNRK